MSRSRVVREEVANFLDYLLNANIAQFTNPVRDDGGFVTWQGYRAGKFLESRDPQSVTQYTTWLENGAFSALLFDASLLQLSFLFAGRELVNHRLAWVPCPFLIDTDYLEIAPIAEVLEMYSAGKPDDVVLQTPIRFDFDLYRAGPLHPAAHVTINSSVCRIACVAPLGLAHFVEFVFKNFYPELWNLHPYLAGMPRAPWGDRTLSTDEESRVHITWR